MGAADVFQEAFRARDDDTRWERITWLHLNGGAEALAIAQRMSTDPDPVRRNLASDVLGQLRSQREAALETLLSMMDHEDDPDILYSIAVGFKHIGDERSVGPLVRLSGHADADVRHGAAFGLLERPEIEALRALATLTADPSPEVRHRAAFGLARQTDADFPWLRDALAARLADDDPDTRAEAIHGLAVRGDERASEPLMRALDGPLDCSDPYSTLDRGLYALADRTGDPRLAPYVEASRDKWGPDDA